MTDLLDEVKHDIKEERTLNFIKHFSKILISTMVVAVAVTGIWLWWNDYSKNESYKEGSELLQAIDSKRNGKFEETVTKLQTLFDNGKTNYAVLAGFEITSYKLFKKDYPGAIEMLEKIANKPDAPKYYRDFAQLNAYVLKHENKQDNTKAFMDNIVKLSHETKIFNSSVDELLATLYINDNNKEAAKNILDKLAAAPSTPLSIAERAHMLLALGKIDANK